jgi:hypothetical protein
MATLACIRRLNAQLIGSSEREIEKRFLDTDGMTEIIPADRSPSNSPLARRFEREPRAAARPASADLALKILSSDIPKACG